MRLAGLFASGRIVDLVLFFVVIEATVLIVLHRKTGRGIANGDLLVSLGAGIALLLALRAALVGLPWPGIAACLVLALVAHLLDLARRWSDR